MIQQADDLLSDLASDQVSNQARDLYLASDLANDPSCKLASDPVSNQVLGLLEKFPSSKVYRASIIVCL